MPSTHAASLDEACRIRLGDLFSEVDHGERSVARDRAAPPGGARGGRPRGILPACRDEPRLRPVGDQPADRGARARGRPAARRALARRRSRRADRGGRARPAALRRDPRPSEGGPGRRRGARRRAVGRVARRHHAIGRRAHPPGPDAAVSRSTGPTSGCARRGARRPPALRRGRARRRRPELRRAAAAARAVRGVRADERPVRARRPARRADVIPRRPRGDAADRPHRVPRARARRGAAACAWDRARVRVPIRRQRDDPGARRRRRRRGGAAGARRRPGRTS